MDIMGEITAALGLEQSFRRSMLYYWVGVGMEDAEKLCFGVTQICLQIFSAHKCGTMPMLLNLSESQFSQLKNRDCNICFFCVFDFLFPEDLRVSCI